MTKMPITVNGIDWTPYVATYGYIETPRKVEGGNGGTMLDGTTRWDILAVKFDLIVPIMPLTMSEINTMMQSCLGGAVSVSYKSARTNTIAVHQMRPDFSALVLALKSPTKEIFSGMTVIFTEA